MKLISYNSECGVCELRCLKGELPWAIDKQLWVITLSSTSDLQPSTAIANQLPGQ